MYPPILLKIVSISKKDALLSGQFQKSTKSHRRSLKKCGIFINLKSNDFYILISLCLPEKAFLFIFFIKQQEIFNITSFSFYFTCLIFF